MAPNEVVGMNDFCLAIYGEQTTRDVERDGSSFFTANLDGCAGVVTAAIKLLVHLVHPIGAVAIDITRAVNTCGSKPMLEVVVDAGASKANMTGNSAYRYGPDAACFAHAVGLGFLPPFPV